MKIENNIKIWAVLFWLILWHFASVVISSDILLVSPIEVTYRFFELIFTRPFWSTVFFSLQRIFYGFMLAVFLGIILGALSSKFTIIEELLAPLILTLKTIPVASFIILTLIWFSSRNLSIFISFIIVLPIIYINVCEGIKSVNIELIEMAKVFKLSAIRKIRYIYVPEVLPFFNSAMTISLGLCWKAGIAAEVIGIPTGSIGENLHQSKLYLDTASLFTWTLVIVIVSLIFEKLILKLLEVIVKLLERV